jgi:PAS domain S-box-containing protein
VDITREKRARADLKDVQARHTTIFEAVRDPIYMKDRDLRYTFANPAAQSFFGLSASRLVGLTDEDIFGPDAGAFIAKEDVRVLGGEVVEEEVSGPNGSGSETFNVVKVPLRDSRGEVVGLCGIARDVSECRLLESQLIQAQKMEAVGAMASGLAHDFNNLLQAICGFTDLLLLERDARDPDYQELMEIRRASRRGSELARKLLNYGRKEESKKRPVDLGELIGQLEGFMERTIPKMIRIEVEPARDLMLVNADPVQMEQVLMNLAVNAKDAMQGRGRLTFSTKNVVIGEEFAEENPGLEPGKYVALSVSDTGHGMDPETRARIFEPFFSTKEPGKGTGLGLATVYAIVKGHLGHVVCESRPLMGATFRVYLPALPGEPFAGAPAKRAHLELKGRSTVLLVDDEEIIRNLGERGLRNFGYSVLTAADGETALKIYRENAAGIDLVILDLIMPGMGGERCLEELMRMDPEVKVLVASGCLGQGQVERCTREGARGFIGKPFEIVQLTSKIKELLGDEDA